VGVRLGGVEKSLRTEMESGAQISGQTSLGYANNFGPKLIVEILRAAGEPLTTKGVQAETRKVRVFCPSSSVVGLNMLRRVSVIKGERNQEHKGWIWWVEDQLSARAFTCDARAR